MKIEEGAIGSVGSQSFELVNGVLVLKAQVASGSLKGSLELDLDGKALVDLVVSKLPEGLAKQIVTGLEGVIFPAPPAQP